MGQITSWILLTCIIQLKICRIESKFSFYKFSDKDGKEMIETLSSNIKEIHDIALTINISIAKLIFIQKILLLQKFDLVK